MNTDPAALDLIEKYLNGKLTPSEAEDFATRMDEDREFARKFRLRKAFPSLFKAEGKDEIMMTVSDTSDHRTQKNKVHFFKTRHIVWLAITALSAGILIYFILLKTTQPARETIVSIPAPLKVIPTALQTPLPERKLTPEPAIAVHQPIELEIPADSMVFSLKEEMLFRWKQETDSFTNFYIISEVNNKLAWWRGIRPGIREYKVTANNFKPGRFYWYVGTKKVKRSVIIKE